MKPIDILLLLLCSSIVAAQPDSISISCNKTTSLIFPLMINSVDRGTRDLLVQRVRGMENILQVKAAKENFNATNLTVITADGKVYPFIASYSKDPKLDIQIDNTPSLFETIAKQKRSMFGVKDKRYDMSLELKGIYIQKGILYFQLQLKNQSNLDYDIDLLRFFIKDKRQGKRTASQEMEQVPLFVYGNTGSVPAQSTQILVIALPQFTIPDKKLLHVQLMEKNGGRNLQLKINNNKIVQASLLAY